MTPPAKNKLECIENSQDVLLLSHNMIVTQPSRTPSPSSQFKMPNTDVVTLIPSGELENIVRIKKSLIKRYRCTWVFIKTASVITLKMSEKKFRSYSCVSEEIYKDAE